VNLASAGPGVAGVDAALVVEAVFRRASVCMAITDQSGTYLEVNDAFCTFLGYSRAELTGKTFTDVTAPQDVIEGAFAMDGLSTGRVDDFSLDKRYVTATGELVWARTTGTAVKDATGDLLRVLVQIDDLTTRRAVEAALDRRASYDELTGLANRGSFYQRLQAALALPPRAVRGVALLVVNLDRFHQVNSGLGHKAGDLILCEAGRRLTAIVRGDDTVSRLGGDEFAVLALGMHDPLHAVALAVDIRDSLKRPYWADGNPIYVSGRVGVVTNVHSVDGETLVQMAAAATEHAKSLTGRWSMHTEGANESSRDQLGFVGDLRQAITDQSLHVAYQPIVDRAGALHHFEALARWNHPERGAVPPDQFIVLAEQNGLIAALTTLVMTRAVQQTAEWRAHGLQASVAVNLSGSLLGEQGLAQQIEGILHTAGLPADALTLEITETALAEGSSPILSAGLAALRATGIRISIDDFGTGYSSLSYLKQLSVDELKIDRSFILDLETDSRTERIVRSTIDLAHSLGLKVVAEGVEDGSVGERLVELGIDYLQGYALARPVSSAATTEWLRAKSVEVVANRARPKAKPALSVLVVDGSPSDRAALRERLRANKHRVLQAQTCEAALHALARRMPDVVILDHMRPNLNGVEIAPRLREAGYAGPILLFNGSQSDNVSAARFPLDVWPVSIEDEALLLDLVDAYATSARATRKRGTDTPSSGRRVGDDQPIIAALASRSSGRRTR
jgi:diguanylate cyclase (GGDEF)-like protein/PAS domain S-box-containing protein